MSDNEAVSTPTVVETVSIIIQNEVIEDELETQLTKVLEKLDSELAEIKFIPSAELIALTEELMAIVNEEDDDDDDFEDYEDDDEEEEDVV